MKMILIFKIKKQNQISFKTNYYKVLSILLVNEKYNLID